MKKMVCEICNSQQIRKVGDVFICQDCGTEYDSVSAKKLLKEIDEKPQEVKNEIPVVPSDDVLVVKEPGMNPDQERLKLEYDLLCWHNFYEKCHELEKSFYMKDKLQGSKSADITQRTIMWDYDQCFYDYVYSEFEDYFKKKNPEFQKKYKMEYDSRYKTNDEHDTKCTIHNDNPVSSVLFFGPLFAGMVLGIVVALVGMLALGDPKFFIWGILIVVVFGIIGAICHKAALSNYDAEATRLNNEKTYDLDSFTFDSYLHDQKEYQAAEKQCRKQFVEKARIDTQDFESNIPALASIRNTLRVSIPLPQKYENEQAVNKLLALVLDRRADSLKEAINLYETEKYRSTVASSLNQLNNNLEALNNNILQLRKSVDDLTNVTMSGFKVMIAQNNTIVNQLSDLQYTQKVIMIDNLLDD